MRRYDKRVPYPIEEELRRSTLQALTETVAELRHALGLLEPKGVPAAIVRKSIMDLEIVFDNIKD